MIAATSIVHAPEPGCMFRRIGDTDTYEVAYWQGGTLYRTSIRVEASCAHALTESLHDVQAVRALLHRAPSAFSVTAA